MSKNIIPVIVIKNLDEVENILNALLFDGIENAEITFRTECASEAIKLAIKLFPNMNIGAGTVINEFQCLDAINSGAKFIVSPGLSVSVAKVCKEHNIPYYPGCVTPTEIMQALELGLNIVKFFPADVYGGLKAIKSLSAPFPQVKFIPTGGIDKNNINEYLENEKIFAVGGSFAVKDALEKYNKK